MRARPGARGVERLVADIAVGHPGLVREQETSGNRGVNARQDVDDWSVQGVAPPCSTACTFAIAVMNLPTEPIRKSVWSVTCASPARTTPPSRKRTPVRRRGPRLLRRRWPRWTGRRHRGQPPKQHRVLRAMRRQLRPARRRRPSEAEVRPQGCAPPWDRVIVTTVTHSQRAMCRLWRRQRTACRLVDERLLASSLHDFDARARAVSSWLSRPWLPRKGCHTRMDWNGRRTHVGDHVRGPRSPSRRYRTAAASTEALRGEGSGAVSLTSKSDSSRLTSGGPPT